MSTSIWMAQAPWPSASGLRLTTAALTSAPPVRAWAAPQLLTDRRDRQLQQLVYQPQQYRRFGPVRLLGQPDAARCRELPPTATIRLPSNIYFYTTGTNSILSLPALSTITPSTSYYYYDDELSLTIEAAGGSHIELAALMSINTAGTTCRSASSRRPGQRDRPLRTDHLHVGDYGSVGAVHVWRRTAESSS